jgi:hypothetical protein
VFSLENRKFQLQQSMEERKQEVTVHLDGLRAEQKFVREDIHRITLELKEREMKVPAVFITHAHSFIFLDYSEIDLNVIRNHPTATLRGL